MLKLLEPVFVALLVVVAVVIGASRMATAQSQSKCYFQPGGVGIVAASGCTITLEDGAALDIDSGASVTGLSTSTLTSLTAGATVLSETLTVTGATSLNGGLTMDSTAFSVADTSGNTQIGGTLGVTGATTLTGNTDVAGTLQYGADDLYPLGYTSVNQQLVCGTTAAFTATTQITPSGLTTPTYVIVSQVTQPAATIAFVTVSDPTTTTFDIYSWGADYNAGTTGVVAHWCAVGDQ